MELLGYGNEKCILISNLPCVGHWQQLSIPSVHGITKLWHLPNSIGEWEFRGAMMSIGIINGINM